MSAGSYTGRIQPLSVRSRLRPRRAAAVAIAFCAVCLAALAILWIVVSAIGGREREHTDLRLQTEVRSAAAEFQAEVAKADTRAGSLAASPALQRAAERNDRETARALIGNPSGVALFRANGLWLGSVPQQAVTRTVAIASRGTRFGRVVGYVPLDESLARRLASRVGVARSDSLALVRDGAASSAVMNRVVALRLSGRAVRAFTVPLVEHPVAVALRGTAPTSAAAARTHRRVLWLVLALIASLATLAVTLYAWSAARRDGATQRRPRRARDARQVLALVGDALASTHEPNKLLPVILHAAMEATGASAGVILRGEREAAREGDLPHASTHGLQLDLTPDGSDENVRLFLYPSAGAFDDGTVALARSLAAQATVALENAHLHTIVKRQAVTDELTGLANRRSFLETLETELRRAQRFGSPLGLVFADLDNFKLVNDRFGHQAGDDVLRAFAGVLQGRIREIDLAARLGGEEFAVLLPETDASGSRALAEDLRAAVTDLVIESGSHAIRVTASFGVAAFPETDGADELMTAADLALYSAKRQGKNRVIAVGPNGA